MEFDRIAFRNVRREKDITQSDLADKVKVSRMTVVHWENGKATPAISQIGKAAGVLGVDPKLFISGV